MMKPPFKCNEKILWTFCLLFSLSIHFCLSLSFYLVPPAPKPSKTDPLKQAKPIMVSLMEHPPKPEPAKQIVDQNTDPSHLSLKPPKNAQFLSQYHQIVEKQTAAQSPLLEQKTRQMASENPVASPPAPLGPELSDIQPKLDWDKYVMDMVSHKETPQANPMRQNKDLQLTNEMTFHSSDHLEGIAKGEQTFLNTKAFRFYTYYARIKQKIQASWEPLVKAKVRELILNGEGVASLPQRTSLLVVLNQFGDIIDIQVLKKSHLKDLDQIAVQSFKSTAPFPHPPKKLIGKDGTIKLRWDFILSS